MSRLGKRGRKAREEVDIDLVPIMNMFLVLIPFLLMSACFFHLKVIDTSVPVLSEATNDAPKKKDVKVTVIMEIKKSSIKLSAISDSVGDADLEKLGTTIAKVTEGEYTMKQLELSLEKIKGTYPKSDTLIIIPNECVVYDTIIQTMDVARYSKGLPLFPKVVLSGRVG